MTVPIHPICHKTIHKYFTNAQLARIGADRQQVLADGNVGRFIAWISGKPEDFDAPVR